MCENVKTVTGLRLTRMISKKQKQKDATLQKTDIDSASEAAAVWPCALVTQPLGMTGMTVIMSDE